MLTVMKHHLCLLLITVISVSSLPTPGPASRNTDESQSHHSNYKLCPQGKPDALNVHLVCHTHNDLGWLKTVDQYYYGANASIQNAGVQYILDSVVESLRRDPRKKFIYVETAFFSIWWNEQPESTQLIVKKLVCSGQLEFIGGGWSMNDEAVTHYNSIIDQMTYGLRILNDTFGKCGVPKVAWQIDPFGHSREQASLFAQMFYDGLFIGRLDYQDKKKRLDTKTMELIWKGSHALGTSSDLFTGVLPNLYSPPDGFCFDILCTDEPIMDDTDLKEYNAGERALQFINIAETQAQAYATNHIIMTMGNDFNYQNAGSWFKNLDKLILHVNKKQGTSSRVNVFYSTPSCYLHALNNVEKNWTVKYDDFFPYANDQYSYWTGYYTSRPSFKRYERVGNNILQICKQLATMTDLKEGVLNALRKAMGIMQHHDAITGTAKQHVTNDYTETLCAAIEKCQDIINDSFKKIMPLPATQETPEQYVCNYLNISSCRITEKGVPFAVTIYNPLAWNITTYVRLPVKEKAYKVVDATGYTIDAQVIPIPEYVLHIPGRQSEALSELVFMVELPPLGYSTYLVHNISDQSVIKKQMSHTEANSGDELTMRNEFISVTIGHTGLLQRIALADGTSLKVNQSFYWYKGMPGDNYEPRNRASGAYVFRPNGTEAIAVGENVSVTFVYGSVVQEIHQVFSPWLSQSIRLYGNTDNCELVWVVGPIPIHDGTGKEIITRFDTDLKNKNEFYTDSNGRQIMKRVKNSRLTWQIDLSEPVSANYYPVTSRIFIRDINRKQQFTVLTDRTQGGSSLKDGSIELMVHRRLLHDDAFGVGEALNEPGDDDNGLTIIGSHHLLLTNIEKAASKHRTLGHMLYMNPYISFSFFQTTNAEYMKLYQMQNSGLKVPLPINVHLLTLEPWKSGTKLIRLEHIYDLDEDHHLSKPVIIELKNLFTRFHVLSIRETTLSANQFMNEAKRLTWKAGHSPDQTQDFKFHAKSHHQNRVEGNLTDLIVSLSPMQIRTFIAHVKHL